MSFLNKFTKPGKDWQKVDASVYSEAYTKFGGSFLTHPQVIDAMSAMVSTPTHYYASYRDNQLIGALAAWDKYLAGDKRFLKKIAARTVFDTGNAEVILPLDPQQLISVKGFKGQFISECNHGNIDKLTSQQETLSLARSFTLGGFSSKFRYNRRRELKQFIKDGGEITPFTQLSAHDIATRYIQLFMVRWDKKPKGHERLEEFITAIRPLVHGHLLTMNDSPVAIQLIYLAQTAVRVSAEYINGGVDQQFQQYSPGSILSFLNIQHAEEIATNAEVPLRFSFGISDKEYKNSWCDTHPLYRF
jgi:hypothetical protein